MFTFCTFLSISLFLSLNFFFVHPASHKRLCLQTLDLAERKVGWTCLYFALFFLEKSWLDVFTFCTFLREKLIGHAFCTFSMLIGRVYILHFFNVDWTCLYFAFFERESWLDNLTFWEKRWLDKLKFCSLFGREVDGKCLHFERKDDCTCLHFATFLSIQLFLSLNSIFVHPGPHKMHIKLAASLIGF